ncbi:hypothetical protein DMA10_03785 [Streptomyces sp. WAC 01420]|nr:hypothetical protein DLM49_30375 [Streptomyces sp. WAC 01438]RSN00741.1 hypothetical protein DMA10_03785 [Streptomyces sp. WAC 01420]
MGATATPRAPGCADTPRPAPTQGTRRAPASATPPANTNARALCRSAPTAEPRVHAPRQTRPVRSPP